MAQQSKILYTKTDEAPALATYSFLPILRAFAKPAGIQFEAADISLAARILAAFPEHLSAEQQTPDTLAELGALCNEPDANIIKLPNISASVPQLRAAIEELQGKGYKIPDYPENDESAESAEIRKRYGKVLGSAVNPVLREGNSDRRAPPSVKNYARKHPHWMGPWSPASQTHVAHMRGGDFYSSEQSTVVQKTGHVRIEHVAQDGSVTVLKERTDVLEKEVIDGMFMSVKALRKFFEAQMEDAKNTNLLFSLHVKAT